MSAPNDHCDHCDRCDRFRSFESLGDAQPFVARIVEIIDRIKVFAQLDQAEVVALARYMRCYRAPAGVEVIVEDEPGDFMLLLIEGTMEIVKKDLRGLPVPIAEASPGKTLGEMSVIDGEPRFASCVTLTEAVFAVLDREQLAHVLEDKPQLGVKLLMQMLVLLNQRLRNVSFQFMRCLDEQRQPAH